LAHLAQFPVAVALPLWARPLSAGWLAGLPRGCNTGPESNGAPEEAAKGGEVVAAAATAQSDVCVP